MQSNARLSSTVRRIRDIAQRIGRLNAYENFKAPTKMDFEAIVGGEVWATHQNNLKQLQSLMHESQQLAARMNAETFSAYRASRPV
ncbi:hypothetical protein PATSB16_37110 [Pandoraea thiooxydans]|uniref:Uncharacterized protein n=1 Tax=Pandoraea thiooxydans TaxID=445709 RepID=A0A0U3VLP3_9BURK|nr:hypothetical protein [Pandoraea thiooxydans]ALX34813.1 hypothetical protein ABW99_15435 [Pandoraea thiooxydans]APR97045.1 hypothetical protein PATSB16_37110 [Pandoraea thiooxydans]